jgi:hypothetical protein
VKGADVDRLPGHPWYIAILRPSSMPLSPHGAGRCSLNLSVRPAYVATSSRFKQFIALWSYPGMALKQALNGPGRQLVGLGAVRQIDHGHGTFRGQPGANHSTRLAASPVTVEHHKHSLESVHQQPFLVLQRASIPSGRPRTESPIDGPAGNQSNPVWSKNSNVADVTCYAPTPGSNFGPAALLWRDPRMPTGEQLSPRLSFWTLRGTAPTPQDL